MNPDPQIRTRTRSNRFFSCSRHPSQPLTGFCPLCLHDRLAVAAANANANADASSSSSTQLSRSQSVRCQDVAASASDQRRRSCDVRVSSTLSDLFGRDDVVKGIEFESKNLEFDNGVGPDWDGDGLIGEEMKTMKEHIDIECGRSGRKINGRDLREVAGKLLKKWRQKGKSKSRGGYNGGVNERRLEAGKDLQSEGVDYGFGRRSCDSEPRFSIDANNRMSLDDSRFSFDEGRASWDGYLIARTIPRLTPMLSAVDNVMLGSMNRVENLQMQVINEDVGNSGELGQSNSDSSLPNRGSGSDLSSSSKSFNKGLGLEGDGVDQIPNGKVSLTSDVIFHGTKLVITERELKDWRLNSLKHGNLEKVESISLGTGSGSNGFKKATTSKWRKVCNLLGHKHRFDERTIGKEGPEKLGNEIDGLEKGDSNVKLIRSSSVVGSRMGHEMVGSYGSARGCSKNGGEEFVLERNTSGRHSMSDLDSGLLRFHLTPFTNYSRSKSGKNGVKNLPAIARNGILQN